MGDSGEDNPERGHFQLIGVLGFSLGLTCRLCLLKPDIFWGEAIAAADLQINETQVMGRDKNRG